MNNTQALRSPQGLGGWFKNLIKGVAMAVGAAIGGPLGAAAAAAVFEFAYDSFGWSFRPGEAGGNTDIPGEAEFKEWLEKSFHPWFSWLALRIGNSGNTKYFKSALFRQKLNWVLMCLNLARVFYSKSSTAGRLTVTVDDDQYKTKDSLIAAYIKTVMDSYALEMKKLGVTVNYAVETAKLSGGPKIYPKGITSWISKGNATFKYVVFAKPGTGSLTPPTIDTGNQNPTPPPTPNTGNGPTHTPGDLTATNEHFSTAGQNSGNQNNGNQTAVPTTTNQNTGNQTGGNQSTVPSTNTGNQNTGNQTAVPETKTPESKKIFGLDKNLVYAMGGGLLVWLVAKK